MAMAAASHVAGHQALSSFGSAPSGLEAGNNQEIMLLMVASAAMIFIDHDRSGQPQNGNQYLALGIVGFVLLFLGEFWPEFAFGFAVLIFVSIILNSPKGLPFVPSTKPSTTTTPTTTTGGTASASK